MISVAVHSLSDSFVLQQIGSYSSNWYIDFGPESDVEITLVQRDTFYLDCHHGHFKLYRSIKFFQFQTSVDFLFQFGRKNYSDPSYTRMSFDTLI